MLLQERDSEGPTQRVSGRLNPDTLSNLDDCFPDHLVRALRPTNSRQPTIRDHVVVRPAKNLARLDRRAKDLQKLPGHRLDRVFVALLAEADQPFDQVDVAP